MCWTYKNKFYRYLISVNQSSPTKFLPPLSVPLMTCLQSPLTVGRGECPPSWRYNIWKTLSCCLGGLTTITNNFQGYINNWIFQRSCTIISGDIFLIVHSIPFKTPPIFGWENLIYVLPNFQATMDATGPWWLNIFGEVYWWLRCLIFNIWCLAQIFDAWCLILNLDDLSISSPNSLPRTNLILHNIFESLKMVKMVIIDLDFLSLVLIVFQWWLWRAVELKHHTC